MRAAGVVLGLLLLAGCAPTGGPGAVTTASGPWRDQIFRVPEHQADGGTINLTMRLCRPQTDAPARAVIINHGTPPLASDRQAMVPAACTGEPSQWFLHHGYVVALPLRRGHGDTAPLAESSGDCANPNYVQAGLVSAADVGAAVDYVTALPFVQPADAVVLGTSTGGWATIAYGSLPHPRVDALISIAGGRGGRAEGVAGQTCRADLLAYSAAYFATTSRTPMLWIYAANDGDFAPATARTLAQSYQAAGGALQFEPVAAFGADGHDLFAASGGSAIWGPIVTRYLAQTAPSPTPTGAPPGS